MILSSSLPFCMPFISSPSFIALMASPDTVSDRMLMANVLTYSQSERTDYSGFPLWMMLAVCFPMYLPRVSQTVRLRAQSSRLPRLPKVSDPNFRELGSKHQVRGKSSHKITLTSDTNSSLGASQNQSQAW